MRIFPCFGNADWTKMVHIVFCTTWTEQKNPLKPLVFCSDLAFVAKQQNQITAENRKSKTLIAHIGVFLCQNMVFVWKVHWWFWKTTIFLQVLELFCSCFVSPFFLILPFGFVGYYCFCFFFACFCCCFISQVSIIWFLFLFFGGFLGFVMCYL